MFGFKCSLQMYYVLDVNSYTIGSKTYIIYSSLYNAQYFATYFSVKKYFDF